jgi:hypothetical protein
MVQKVFIPMIVKVYIAIGIVLYTIQKIRIVIRKMRIQDPRQSVKLKTGF